MNGQSLLGNIKALAENDAEFIKALKEDALISQVRIVLESNQTNVTPTYLANQDKINKLMRTYILVSRVSTSFKLFDDASLSRLWQYTDQFPRR